MDIQSSPKPLCSTSHFSSNLLLPLLPPSSDASEAKDPVSLEEEPVGVDQGLSEIPPAFYADAVCQKGPASGRGLCYALVSEARPSSGIFQVSFLRNGVLSMLPGPAVPTVLLPLSALPQGHPQLLGLS